MDLELTIHPERIGMMVGEDIPLKIRVTNRSARPLSIPNPEVSGNWPRIRLVNTKTKQERFSSRLTVSAGKTGAFRVPLPEPLVTIEPGQSLESSPLLSQLASLPASGSYELSAAIRWGEKDSVESNVIPVSVAPLHLLNAALFGAQSGPEADRFLLYTATTDTGAAVFLSGTRKGERPVPLIDAGIRLASVGKGAVPTMSVTASGVTWPAQWIVWLEGRNLAAEYLMQWQIALPEKANELAAGDVHLIGPAFLDLKHAEGEKPAPGDVALLSGNGKSSLLEVKTLSPEGGLREGPKASLEGGELLWSSAWYPPNGVQRYVMAFARRGGLELLVVSREEAGALGSPQTIGRLKGRALASGVCSSEAGKLAGATVTAEQSADAREAYRLFRWSVGQNGETGLEKGVDLATPRAAVFTAGSIAVNQMGNVRIALRTGEGDWYLADESGKCTKIDDRVLRGRSVAGIYWAEGTVPFLLVADPEGGITTQGL